MTTLQTVASFDDVDGASPEGGLIAGPTGDLFGTTNFGGTVFAGTVFEIGYSPSTGYASNLTSLFGFNNDDGSEPSGKLIADANGDLFGTSEYGGEVGNVGGYGAVFELVNTASGYAAAPTSVATFVSTDGANPEGGLVSDANGDLFGSTLDAVFEIANSATGYDSTPVTLASFTSLLDGYPNGGLVSDANGDLFGTTDNGGATGVGSVFEVANTPTGYANTITIPTSFSAAGGYYPEGGLVADAAGDLFGTTALGGTNDDGTVFEIVNTTTGYASAPVTLINFNGADGEHPYDTSLIIDGSGDLLGSTTVGGEFGDGTVFEIGDIGGSYASTPATLANFNRADGATPTGTLTFGANGALFGTTETGGTDDEGTVFEITGDVITGTVADQPDINAAPIDPFASVRISDFNVAQTQTVTVTPSTNVTLADPNAATDRSSVNNGVYTVTGSAAAVSADLNALIVDATGIPGETVVTGFTITDTDTAGSTTTDSTTSVISSGVPLAPPVIGTLQNASYAAGDSGLLLDPDLSLSDTESSTCYGATVSIGAGFQDIVVVGRQYYNDDELSLAAAFPDISASYDNSSGVLTLYGTASVAEYQAALDSVTFLDPSADPTLQGTDDSRTINWSIDDGITTGSATTTVSVTFANNPTADVLWQNADGQFAIWQMGDLNPTAWNDVGGDENSFAMATGGFFPGDTHDLAGQNANGTVVLWQINGSELVGQDILTPYPGIAWHIRGAADFYNDGNTDILWQNDSGQVAIWDMSGATLVDYGFVGNPGPEWLVKGAGDFYDDGNSDILFQNGNGVVSLWDMQGTSIIQSGTVDAVPGTSWRIVGTGDFYGDGNTDILWQDSNGELAIWDMDGTSIVQGGTVAANPGSDWHAVGTGDYNDDSNADKSDIMLQYKNGIVVSWEMDGTTPVATGLSQNTGAAWNTVTNDTMLFIQSEYSGETLAATPTTPDEFIFTAAAAGTHTITGFNPVQDMIELSGFQFPTFAAVESATIAGPGGATIDIGNGVTLLLAGISPAALHANNFALT